MSLPHCCGYFVNLLRYYIVSHFKLSKNNHAALGFWNIKSEAQPQTEALVF